MESWSCCSTSSLYLSFDAPLFSLCLFFFFLLLLLLLFFAVIIASYDLLPKKPRNQLHKLGTSEIFVYVNWILETLQIQCTERNNDLRNTTIYATESLEVVIVIWRWKYSPDWLTDWLAGYDWFSCFETIKCTKPGKYLASTLMKWKKQRTNQASTIKCEWMMAVRAVFVLLCSRLTDARTTTKLR